MIFAQCAQVAVPEASELALQYYKSGNFLWIVKQFWSLFIPLLFLVTGFSGKLGQLSEKWGKNWLFTIFVYLILFIPLFQICNLPLDLYGDFIRQHAYGLSNQTFERWFSNWGKELGVAIVSSFLFVWIFYLLLKKSPKRWWLYSSLASIAITFFMIFVQPIWIDPLFHNFCPMENAQLEKEILNLAHKSGIEGARVFQVDMSQDTKMLNAYVTGFGSSKRIVLWDTTLNTLKPDEILFVMGHEMGHYVLHHIWWEMCWISLITFAIFYLIHRSAHYLLAKYNHRFKFYHLAQIASLPLLLLLLTFYQLLFLPLSNVISRHYEHEADQFGLEITQNNEAAAKAFIALQQENLANPRPGPLFVFWRASHPPLGARIDYCNEYCPWKMNQPLRFEKYFTPEECPPSKVTEP